MYIYIYICIHFIHVLVVPLVMMCIVPCKNNSEPILYIYIYISIILALLLIPSWGLAINQYWQILVNVHQIFEAYCQLLTQTHLSEKSMSLFENKKKQSACGHLFSRKHGLGTPKRTFSSNVCFFQMKKCLRPPFSCKQLLGVPTHIKMLLILINIRY